MVSVQQRDIHANPRKTSTIRRLGPVDIAALKTAVLAITEDVWDAENADKPNRFEAKIAKLSATTCIRFQVGVSWQTGRSLIAARVLP